MPADPNVLVTHRPEEQPLAAGEVEARLEEMEVGYSFLPSRVDGLFQLRVDGAPAEVTRRLRELCTEAPQKFLHTYRWIPVTTWTPVDFQRMRSAVRGMVPAIGEEDKWRLLVNKRFHDEHTSQEIVEAVAEAVDRPRVDLENPDVIIRIEIIGDRAGLVLHRPEEVLDVNEVRRFLGLEAM